MSQAAAVPIAAVTTSSIDPLESYRSQFEMHDFSRLEQSALGGHLSEPVDDAAPTSPMHVGNLMAQFSDGLHNGFYSRDMARLQASLVDANASAGEVTSQMLQLQAKIGIAEAFMKMSNKLAEGLQTVVVKQG